MKVGKIIKNTALGAGYVGLICYGGMMACEAYNYINEKVKTHKGKQWKRGYDDAAKELKSEIDYLKEQNSRLIKEAYKMTEAAE